MKGIHDINHDQYERAPWCHCSERRHHRRVNCFANPWSVKVLWTSGNGTEKQKTGTTSHDFNVHTFTYMIALYLKSNHLQTYISSNMFHLLSNLLTMVSFGDLVGRGTIRHLRGRWIGDSHPKELNPCIANPNQRRLRNCIFWTPNMHLDLAPFPSVSSFSKPWFITEIDNLKVFKTKSFQLISSCTQFPSVYFFWIAIQSDPFRFFFLFGPYSATPPKRQRLFPQSVDPRCPAPHPGERHVGGIQEFLGTKAAPKSGR